MAIKKWGGSSAAAVLAGVNRLLRPMDEWLLARPDPPRPVLFILGPPRSGTTLTYQVVTQHFEVAYFSAPFGYLYGAPNALCYTLRNLQKRPKPDFESSYGHIKGLLAPSEHGRFWSQWFPESGALGHRIVPDGLDASRYSELRDSVRSMSAIFRQPMAFKNVYLSLGVGALAQIFPEALFLLVRREPYFVAQSLLTKRLGQSDPNEWWSVKTPGFSELAGSPPWRQVCDQAFLTERIMLEDAGRYASGRCLEVHYEDLCQAPGNVIRRIADWLTARGVSQYADLRVPPAFDKSKRIVLPADVEENIRACLAELKREHGACLQ